MKFVNREEAGKKLAEKISAKYPEDAVVYALPRGGVIIGAQIAKILGAPLDLIIPRKVGHPLNAEYAVCAVTEEGELLCNEADKNIVATPEIQRIIEKEKAEAKRRREVYLGQAPHFSASGKIAIIADDGIATGLTIRAAIKSLKKEHPKKIIVAVPVAPHDTVLKIKQEADEVVILKDEKYYTGSVGAYYYDFPQIGDEKVIALLRQLRP